MTKLSVSTTRGEWEIVGREDPRCAKKHFARATIRYDNVRDKDKGKAKSGRGREEGRKTQMRKMVRKFDDWLLQRIQWGSGSEAGGGTSLLRLMSQSY